MYLVSQRVALLGPIQSRASICDIQSGQNITNTDILNFSVSAIQFCNANGAWPRARSYDCHVKVHVEPGFPSAHAYTSVKYDL